MTEGIRGGTLRQMGAVLERRGAPASDLAVAVSAGGAGCWAWDVLSGSVTWDRAHARLFDGSAFGGTLPDWLALVHPDDRMALAEHLMTAAQERAEFGLTYRVLTTTGQVRWVLSRGRSMTRDGDPRRLVGLSMDVTAGRTEESGTQRLMVAFAGLAAAVTVREVIVAALTLGVHPLGFTRGRIALAPVQGGAARGLSVEGPAVVALDDDAALQAVIASGVPRLPWLPRPADLPGRTGDADLLLLPLQAGGRTVGALSAHLPAGVVLRPEERRVLLLLAGQCAESLARAVAHEGTAEVAGALQRQLLPYALPEVPGMELAGRYLPGTEGLMVGGDWYDALHSPSGAVLVVGDVVGKGLGATALMSRARHTLNAYSALGLTPTAVLEAADRLANNVLAESEIVTAVVAAVDGLSGLLTCSSAGHPPPLVIGPDGEADFLPVEPQPPLGTWSDRPRAQGYRGALAPGAVLLLYSDGLVERRDRDLDDGLSALRDAATALSTGRLLPLDQLLDALVTRLVGPDRADDVTLLAVRMDPRA